MRHLHLGRRPGRPSPALVIAIIALVCAAAGTGYAAIKVPKNSVGTAQIKNKAVTPPKVKGDLPSAGVAGLSIVKRSQLVSPGTAGVATITCPSGLVAVSGGAEAPHTFSSFILDSHPTAAHGWELSLANSGGSAETVNFSAVCVKPAPGTPKAARGSARVVERPLR